MGSLKACATTAQCKKAAFKGPQTREDDALVSLDSPAHKPGVATGGYNPIAEAHPVNSRFSEKARCGSTLLIPAQRQAGDPVQTQPGLHSKLLCGDTMNKHMCLWCTFYTCICSHTGGGRGMAFFGDSRCCLVCLWALLRKQAPCVVSCGGGSQQSEDPTSFAAQQFRSVLC